MDKRYSKVHYNNRSICLGFRLCNESYPIKDIPVLRELFLEKKTENIWEEIRKDCECGGPISKEDVAYYPDCDMNLAENSLKQFIKECSQAILFL